ncbi:MAG: DUF4160 domain-containing protein, partial [Rectinemataceae bacterium]
LFFLGIIIALLYDDHAPPHFHAVYGEFKIMVEKQTGIVEGKFPKRALNAVMEWYELHRDELLSDWELAKKHEPLKNIPPLE